MRFRGIFLATKALRLEEAQSSKANLAEVRIENCYYIYTKIKIFIMYELSKREKKIAREAIEKGVQAEFKAGLEKAKKVIAEWEKGDHDNRAAYQKL